GFGERGDADADQPELGAIDFARQQVAPGGEDARRQLGRMRERLRPRADAEISGLELERHRRAGEIAGLEPGGHLLLEPPQPQLQRPELGDALGERGLRRDALGLALGLDRAIVAAMGEVGEPPTLAAVATLELALPGALQVADRAQPVAG